VSRERISAARAVITTHPAYPGAIASRRHDQTIGWRPIHPPRTSGRGRWRTRCSTTSPSETRAPAPSDAVRRPPTHSHRTGLPARGVGLCPSDSAGPLGPRRRTTHTAPRRPGDRVRSRAARADTRTHHRPPRSAQVPSGRPRHGPTFDSRSHGGRSSARPPRVHLGLGPPRTRRPVDGHATAGVDRKGNRGFGATAHCRPRCVLVHAVSAWHALQHVRRARTACSAVAHLTPLASRCCSGPLRHQPATSAGPTADGSNPGDRRGCADRPRHRDHGHDTSSRRSTAEQTQAHPGRTTGPSPDGEGPVMAETC
jgi:hypothetical protein